MEIRGAGGDGAWKATSEVMSLALPPARFSLPLSPQERPLMGSQEEDGVPFHGVGWRRGGGGAVSVRQEVRLLSGAPCLLPSWAWSSDPALGRQRPFSSKHRVSLQLPA